jgi:hypothetical protein
MDVVEGQICREPAQIFDQPRLLSVHAQQQVQRQRKIRCRREDAALGFKPKHAGVAKAGRGRGRGREPFERGRHAAEQGGD